MGAVFGIVLGIGICHFIDFNSISTFVYNVNFIDFIFLKIFTIDYFTGN
jgi:hypothetical protein